MDQVKIEGYSHSPSLIFGLHFQVPLRVFDDNAKFEQCESRKSVCCAIPELGDGEGANGCFLVWDIGIGIAGWGARVGDMHSQLYLSISTAENRSMSRLFGVDKRAIAGRVAECWLGHTFRGCKGPVARDLYGA